MVCRCFVCRKESNYLIFKAEAGKTLIQQVEKVHQKWDPNDPICPHCSAGANKVLKLDKNQP